MQEEASRKTRALVGLIGKPYPPANAFQGIDMGTVAPTWRIADRRRPDRQPGVWDAYETVFPATGLPTATEPLAVFACLGNHDGDAAGATQQGFVGRKGTQVTIDEATHYPFDGKVRFTVTPRSRCGSRFTCVCPAGAGNRRSGSTTNRRSWQSKPGGYLLVDRTWKAGDRVGAGMPMDIAVTTWTANKNSVSINRGPLTFSLKIGEEYRRAGGTDAWPAWEILPTTAWNYALEFDPQNLAASFRVVERPWPANDMPFTHEGTPLEIQAQARKLPNWKEDHLGLVDKLQPSPVKSSEPVETVTLIPMGAARLRLSAVPVVGSGPDAREWQLPPEPLTSYSRGGPDPYEAMFDGKVPQALQ